jgi:hypothetical protein
VHELAPLPAGLTREGLLADIDGIDKRRNVEEWADALLERNRTAPPDTSLEDEPVIQYMRERSEHYAGLHRRFANIEAVLVMVGTVLLCVFVFAFHSGF